MRVLIVNPPAVGETKFVREGRCEQRLSSFQYVMLPVSLPSTAAVLRKGGHEVKIIDCIAGDVNQEELEKKAPEFDPGMVIFNFSTVTFEGDARCAERLRALSAAHFTAIGVHVTVLPEPNLNVTTLDSVIRGEPEITALALADALQGGKPLSDVCGISFKEGGRIVYNADREFYPDLDTLPFPARDLLENEKYTMPISNKPYTLIVTSRGCPHDCIFCTAHCYYGKKLRKRSAGNIVDEMQEVKEKYGINDVTMWSDTFTVDKSFVYEVCDEIEKRGLKINWMCNSRVDCVYPNMLKRMAETGCTVMSYGVESGVQEILDAIKKRITVDQIRDAFRWTREAKIETIAHVIFGLPGETPESINKTTSFIRSIRPDYVQFYCAIPFPGTAFYEMAVERGWLTTKDWSKFEINQAIINTPELTDGELKKAREGAYRDFYLRPSYVLTRLSKSRSAGEAVNLFREGIDFLKSWVASS